MGERGQGAEIRQYALQHYPVLYAVAKTPPYLLSIIYSAY